MASGQNSVQVSYGVVNYQKNTVHRGPTQEWTREASFRPRGQRLLTAYTRWVTPPEPHCGSCLPMHSDANTRPGVTMGYLLLD